MKERYKTMNVTEIWAQIETLQEAMQPTDDFKCDIFYGVSDGKLGFHMVSEDYPNYFISYMGATLEEAQLCIEREWSD